MKPSDYLKRFYYSFELEESTLPHVIERIGAEQLLYASDYPHWDCSWPNTVKIFSSRADVSDAHRRLIMSENPQRFYGFTADAAGSVGAA